MHLTVVGNGEEYNHLIQYECEQVHFTGAVPPEIRGHMEQADADYEFGFEGPDNILMFISYGLPVISMNVGGIGEVLRFGQDLREDATAESIQMAIGRINEYYEIYSKNAYDNSKAYDYRYMNRKVYDRLCEYWR